MDAIQTDETIEKTVFEKTEMLRNGLKKSNSDKLNLLKISSYILIILSR